jgi:hypothetical protein
MKDALTGMVFIIEIIGGAQTSEVPKPFSKG